jgi:hypothetical protein
MFGYFEKLILFDSQSISVKPKSTEIEIIFGATNSRFFLFSNSVFERGTVFLSNKYSAYHSVSNHLTLKFDTIVILLKRIASPTTDFSDFND